MTTEKRLTRSEVNDLVREYRKTRSVELRNRIAENFIDLVKRVATVMASRLAKNVDPDELVAFGMPALLWAVDHYDPDNGASFSTFATRRIHGAIMDEIRDLDYVPRLTRGRARVVTNAQQTFYAEHGRQPTRKELQTVTGLGDNKFRLLADDTVIAMGSLSETLSRGEDYGETLASTIEARAEVELGTETDAHTLMKEMVLPALGLRSALMMKCRYVEGMTLLEIGKVLGVSECRVSQMHAQTLDWLRSVLSRDRRAA